MRRNGNALATCRRRPRPVVPVLAYATRFTDRRRPGVVAWGIAVGGLASLQWSVIVVCALRSSSHWIADLLVFTDLLLAIAVVVTGSILAVQPRFRHPLTVIGIAAAGVALVGPWQWFILTVH